MQRELARRYNWAFKPEFVLEGKFVCFHLAVATKASQQQTFGDEEYLDVVPATISRWLRGDAPIIPKRVKRIAEIVCRDEESLVKRNDQIAEFERAFEFLETSRSLGRVAPIDMPQIAKEFLKLLGLPTKVGESLDVPSIGGKSVANEAISSGKRADGVETTSPFNLPHHDDHHAGDTEAKNSRKRWLWASCAISLCALGIGAFAFVSFPAFASPRVSLAERLSGTDLPPGVTIHARFDEPDRTFIGDLTVQSGFLMLTREAVKGGARAQYALGMAHLLGVNVQKDQDKGLALLAQSHDQGYELASQAYAFALSEGVGSVFDPDEALSIYEALAANKNAGALNSIGQMYEHGFLKPYNPMLALRYYQEASDLGNAHATNNLGNLYHHGAFGHVEVDTIKAEQAYEQALLGGVAAGRTNLALLYFENGRVAEGLSLLEEGVKDKQTVVMIRFAEHLISGEYLEINTTRARELLEDAVAQGNGDAAFELAELLEKLNSGEVQSELDRLFALAADTGGSWTQAQLAFRAEHDPNLPSRTQIAARHYQIASDRGHGRAAYRLAAMILDGRLADRTKTEAIELLRRGVARGDPYAQWRFSLILLDQNETPTDPVRGMEMLRTAGERGDFWVTNNVGSVFDGSRFGQGRLVERDVSEAAHWYLEAFEREGYNRAACNYVAAQLELDGAAHLSDFDELLAAGLSVHAPRCLTLLFSDLERLESWGKSYSHLEKVLLRYIETGNSDAIEHLRRLRSSVFAGETVRALENPVEYRDLHVIAAEAGSLDAMIKLGRGLFGNSEIDKQFELPIVERVNWLRRATSQGSLEAWKYLHQHSSSAPPTRDWADELKRKSRIQSNPTISYILGLSFDYGVDGVGKDLTEAESWYRKAASVRDDAKIRLARVLSEGCHREVDLNEVVELVSNIRRSGLRRKVVVALSLLLRADGAAPKDGLFEVTTTVFFDILGSGNFLELDLDSYSMNQRCNGVRRAYPITHASVFQPGLGQDELLFRAAPFKALYPYP
ncbi:tetratricopeptide repeat protein [Roseobacter sp. MH60115]|uniref:tetratricopeptide repeat protein n=1 Tax=Roseobacter sp. MH60115 TaxID=2785324 RepID=UPI0018A2D254|nr:SEL1-like repeat protein [Roseobacter sp. MH60115]